MRFVCRPAANVRTGLMSKLIITESGYSDPVTIVKEDMVMGRKVKVRGSTTAGQTSSWQAGVLQFMKNRPGRNRYILLELLDGNGYR